MAGNGPIHCSVVTPERAVLEADVTAIVYPQHDGMAGVLKDRAPIVCQLGIGELRVDLAAGGSKRFVIDGGFCQVIHNKVAILTQHAVAAEEIDPAQARRELEAAEAMKVSDASSLLARQEAVARAKALIAAAERR